ncbi:hypothetical protein [Geobacter sp. SVR]|uniref:hypothetical protein n=1 Tax=Geobacter sp. SVR TaxID=2495594 RepID=UPI00143EFFEA|nr:hypothetical protein [Geobacter sp. SVR]BCS55688.1 hypothetical protein GSVR_39960 [Geobacter sp. SVR]GCF83692.1 hypothetical protein GSbR_02920 [Geobacter sp. SVR]
MDQFHLPLFLLNTLLVLLDASLGFFLAPRLLSLFNPDDPEAGASVARSTRRLLPAIVALYMFFNCLGYFQARPAYLLTVCGLILTDLALQLLLRRKARRFETDQGDEHQ